MKKLIFGIFLIAAIFIAAQQQSTIKNNSVSLTDVAHLFENVYAQDPEDCDVCADVDDKTCTVSGGQQTCWDQEKKVVAFR